MLFQCKMFNSLDVLFSYTLVINKKYGNIDVNNFPCYLFKRQEFVYLIYTLIK